MRKQTLACLTTILALIAVTPVRAQSGNYFKAITNLNPVIYLPLTETTVPPSSQPAAANLGSLGAADNGTYRNGALPGALGALAGGGDSDTGGLFSGVTDAGMFATYDTAYASDAAFTIELWVNSAYTDQAEECIVSCVDAASPRNGWLIYEDGTAPGTFNFRTYSGNGTTVSDGANGYVISVPGGHLVANTWYHLVVTFDGTNAQAYINGVAATNTAVATAYTTSTAGAFAVGARSDNSFNFNGLIDEVALYPTVLSASDISNHYTAGISGPSGAYHTAVTSDNPQLYFRLDDAAATLAQNYGSAGALADGYYQTGTTPGVAGPNLPGLGGANSFAVQFPGGVAADNGATVLVPGASGLAVGDSNAVTLTMWAQGPNGSGSFQTMIGKGDQSYRFDLDPTHPHWNAGNINEITGADVLNDGKWHFWAGTWDGSNNSVLYIDGQVVGTSTGNAGPNGTQHVLDIGDAPDYAGRNFSEGAICQVAVFPTALSASQVQDLLFAAGTPPVLVSQPVDSVVLAGSNITFTVSALGQPPLSYQWYGPELGGATPPAGMIPGATNTTLTISSAEGVSGGAYFVVVTDGNGVTTTSGTSPNGTPGIGANLNVITNPLPGTYFSAVVNLNPLGYWPLNETNQPAPWPAIATNSGSLGDAGDAIYSGQIFYQNPSALASDPDASVIGNGNETQIVLPYQSSLATVPVTVEGWFSPNATFNNGGETLFSDGEPASPNTGFWVNAGFHTAANGQGDFNLLTYYNSGTAPGVNIDVTNITAGQWYYVAVTIAPNPSSNSPATGYLTTFYINGTNAGSGVSDFVPNADAPFKIGNRSDDPGYGSYNFAGGMDEVAFYPSALSAATIAAHYAAGTNPTPSVSYSNLVQQSTPLLYYRLDEAQPNFPSQDAGPVAMNYGGTGANDNGVYLTGSFPGAVPGPISAGFPGDNVAVSFNHIYWFPGGPATGGTFGSSGLGNTGLTGYVDVPEDNFNSLDYLGPVSLAAWVQATPNDGGRFETFVGRGDPSYRMDVDGTSDDLLHFAYGGAGDQNGVLPAGSASDSVWHFVVGVWDGTRQYLYVDGVSNSASAATGLPTGDDYDFTIGEAPDDTGRLFDGNLAEVAIFSSALSAAQVKSLYDAAQVSAEIVQEPAASQVIGEGLDATISVGAAGNPTLVYQWFFDGSPVSGPEFSGANSNVLTITATPLSDAGSYTVVVSNSYGSVTSTPSLLTVLATPIINPQLPATNYALAGNSVTLAVGYSSSSPVTNAWYFNGVLLTNGANITGATSTNLSILSAEPGNAGTYVYWATNAAGTASSSSTLVILPIIEPTFDTNGTYWTANNNGVSTLQGAFLTNDVIEMTTGGGSEDTSFFFNVPMYINAFRASFTYRDVDMGSADGGTFCIQNSAAGPAAIGTQADNGGSGGGYSIITNSVALQWELYPGSPGTPGLRFETNGSSYSTTLGAPYTAVPYGLTGAVDLTNGDNIQFSLLYDGQTLSVTLTDTNTSSTYTTNYDVGPISQYIGGDSAFIGFTASTGGATSTQTIADFSFTPIPVLSASESGGAVTISWPTGMGLGPYALQQSSTLSPSATWTTVPGPYNVVGDQYQLTVGAPTGNLFYRMVLTP